METVLEPGGTGVRLAPGVRGLREAVSQVPGAEQYEVRAFAKTGTPRVELRVDGNRLDREGSVLVMGILITPPESGAAASRRIPDFVSACPATPDLRDRILSVPPASSMDGSIAVTMAVYLDDLDPEGRDGRATQLGAQLVEAAVPYLVKRVTEAVAGSSNP